VVLAEGNRGLAEQHTRVRPTTLVATAPQTAESADIELQRMGRRHGRFAVVCDELFLQRTEFDVSKEDFGPFGLE